MVAAVFIGAAIHIAARLPFHRQRSIGTLHISGKAFAVY